MTTGPGIEYGQATTAREDLTGGEPRVEGTAPDKEAP